MSLIHLAVTENIVPTRNLNLLYIILDSIFLIVFLSLLIWKKRYETVLLGYSRISVGNQPWSPSLGPGSLGRAGRVPSCLGLGFLQQILNVR